MPYKPKNRLMFQILIATSLAAVILLALIPLSINTKSITGDLIKIKGQLSSQINRLDNLVSLREEAGIARSKLPLLQEALPSKDGLFSLPAEIEELGVENDVAINFTFGSESNDKIVYTISAQGTYEEVINFMKVIEEEVSFMNIESATVLLKGGEYGMTISGNVFFNSDE